MNNQEIITELDKILAYINDGLIKMAEWEIAKLKEELR